MFLTLQDGGCSCPGDVAKAFGKDVGRAQKEEPIEEDVTSEGPGSGQERLRKIFRFFHNMN